MVSIKSLKSLVFMLFPVSLLAMLPTNTDLVQHATSAPAATEHGSWTNKNNITFEWYKVTDKKTFFDLYKQLTPVIAEAFADEAINFLLDEKLQIKPEYVELIKKLSPSGQSELADLIKASSLQRTERVAYAQDRVLQMLEMQANSSEEFSDTCFVVTAKNSANNTVGFAIFEQGSELKQEHVQELDLLAITPDAQGQGLARPLVFSILTLAPDTKYIVLGTKSWNTRAQAVYKKFGFTVCSDKVPGNISFKYEVKS